MASFFTAHFLPILPWWRFNLRRGVELEVLPAQSVANFVNGKTSWRQLVYTKKLHIRTLRCCNANLNPLA